MDGCAVVVSKDGSMKDSQKPSTSDRAKLVLTVQWGRDPKERSMTLVEEECIPNVDE